MSALYQGHIATTPIFFFTQKLSMLNKRLDRYKNNARGAMNTRKLLTIPRMQLLVSILALPVASGMYAKQSPGFMSPTQVASMQREREMAPIDKIELAKAQEQFKPRPVKYTRKGKAKKQRQPRKTLRYMTYEETKVGKDKLVASGNYTVALKYLERMVKLCDDINELEMLHLELADTQKACAHYDIASALYTQFVQGYPGSNHTQYALYQAIECTHQRILDADRDQANTHKTIELADQFLEKEKPDTALYAKAVQIRDTCYKRLIKSEYKIYSFYLNDGKFKQAERRLASLRETWIEKMPQLEPELLVKEYELAKKQQNLEIAQSKQEELTRKFPTLAHETVAVQTPTRFLAKF